MSKKNLKLLIIVSIVITSAVIILSETSSPCGLGYTLIGDICEPTPFGYIETRNEYEMAVDSKEAAGVEQDYNLELKVIILSETSSPCGLGYTLIGDICEPTPFGYIETRNECEMAVDSKEAAGVEQDYNLELKKCR